jgi:hypothetical protein
MAGEVWRSSNPLLVGAALITSLISGAQTFTSTTISSTVTSLDPEDPVLGVVLVSARVMGRELSSKIVWEVKDGDGA